MIYVDATCPLVSKVHVEAQRHFDAGREIVLIGHAGHPEVIGTMGQLPEGAITLIETVADAEAFTPRDPAKLSFVTQTTLSVDDTAEIVAALQRRFPGIAAPHKEDICYATTNRQDAVKAMARACDLVLVIGSPKSSNSVRLVEVAKRAGAKRCAAGGVGRGCGLGWFDGVAQRRRHRRRQRAGRFGGGLDRRHRRTLRCARRRSARDRGGRGVQTAARVGGVSA